jgi:hypothetical protein
LGSPQRANSKTASRFWRWVDTQPRPSGCHLWTGSHDRDGYGYFWDGRTVKAHRFALELALGPLAGATALHDCDTPACVRVGPGHLRVGTQAENIADRTAKGRTSHGAAHYKAQLTEAIVVEARGLYDGRRGSAKRLADRFGVDLQCMWKALKGVNWAHLPAPPPASLSHGVGL